MCYNMSGDFMDGLIIVNKEKGYTSRDVVNIIGKIFKTKQVGHTGTLDPLAEGVLVICIGNATKLVDMITSYDKEYIAEVTLGIKTDTLDITGNVLEEENIKVEEKEIKLVLESFVGTYLQEVPLYSAVKIDGKKLYEYARENVDIVLPKRQVTVNRLELISDVKYVDNKTIFSVKASVSKGTYIRSLINDIAFKLNTIGVMSSLVRTKQGAFNIDDAYTIDMIKNDDYKLITIEEIFKDIKRIVTEDKKILNSNIIDNIYGVDQILFYNKDNELLSLYVSFNDKLKPYKVFKR
jgi:tRNA pseudouridine55 synthase